MHDIGLAIRMRSDHSELQCTMGATKVVAEREFRHLTRNPSPFEEREPKICSQPQLQVQLA